MKKFLVIASVIIGLPAMAQFRLGIFGGIANYQGDLVDKPFQSPKGAVGLSFGYDFSPRFGLRAGLTFAKVAGADSLNPKADFKLRNLSFQSPITEFSLTGTVNLLDIDEKGWTPYAFAGLAVFHFNPYTLDGRNNKIYLQALSTEGQGLPGYGNRQYTLTQIAIPFGGGVKFALSDKVQVGLETGLRKLFTDYLDDVSGNYAAEGDLLTYRGQQAVNISYRSDERANGAAAYPSKGTQRGSPKYKDYYYFTGIHISFALGDGGGGFGGGGHRRGYGCPASVQ